MATKTWNIFSPALFLTFFTLFLSVNSLPDQGIWDAKLDQEHQFFTVYKSLFNNSEISVKIECHSSSEVKIKVGWLLRMTECADEYVGAEEDGRTFLYYTDPRTDQLQYGYKQIELQRSAGDDMLDIDTAVEHEKVYKCTGDEAIMLANEENDPHHTQIVREIAVKKDDTTPKTDGSSPKPVQGSENDNKITPAAAGSEAAKKDEKAALSRRKRASDEDENPKDKKNAKKTSTTTPIPTTKAAPKSANHAVVKSWKDGIYLFILKIDPMGVSAKDFSADVQISMKGPQGYLSAIEFPLLPFYGVMCAVYVIFACVWLVMTACNWRDLLRIQFWIGGVIILGMLEKAVFYAEYQTINYTGKSVKGAVVFAEIVSCLKRTLARMLVVIVSLGFGIVKPRLGAMLHRVLGMGLLYFVLGVIEGCMRVTRPKGDMSNQPLLASIPLAVLDAAICWWVFTSLVNTTRTLRLRRNIVKLSLYRHFTNVLIFAVLASIAFMIWSIKQHKLANCLTDWREIWVDDAYWHILFSVILLAIIILWRPTNNNQRYAFSPLLDPPEDEDTEDEDETPMNDAFDGMKMRNSKEKRPMKDGKSKTEDDLKWIEENIPSSVADSALPAMLDSDEEIMTTKFEMSKME